MIINNLKYYVSENKIKDIISCFIELISLSVFFIEIFIAKKKKKEFETYTNREKK